MAHTHTSLKHHVIFSTQGRRPFIQEHLEQQLWAYMAGTAHKKGFTILKAGGVEDHIHLLVELPPDMDLSKVVQMVKANSSHWMKQHEKSFAWQRGFAAFSVSESLKMKTMAYIANQRKHHKRKSYADELKELLILSGVAFKDDELLD